MTLMSNEHVIATYIIETALPLQHAAEVLAGEQSTGTFVRVERETDDLRARFAAQVESIEEIPLTGASPLPGFIGDPAHRRRARLRLRFPLDNFGPSMPNLLAAVAGNLFEIKELSAIRLVDLELPQPFADRYAGPAFGVEGTRRLMSRPTGAMIGTIIKPSIGLSPADLAEVVDNLATAGVDFIKDDELQGNGPSAPLAERVKAVMPVLERHADRTGVKPMYAFNITDDIDRLEANHDLVVAAGGTCVMACINFVGLAGLDYLRRRSVVPIHGHRAMLGATARSEQVGIGFRAWQQLARLAGADHLHTNGISNKFYETDAEVLDSIAAVRTPLLGLTPTVPVLSSGQWAGLAHATYEAVGTTDLLVLAGGGIHGHPDGAAAGVASMRNAWASAERGENAETALAASAELRRATDLFGPVRVRGHRRLLRRRLHRQRRRAAAVRPTRLERAAVHDAAGRRDARADGGRGGCRGGGRYRPVAPDAADRGGAPARARGVPRAVARRRAVQGLLDGGFVAHRGKPRPRGRDRARRVRRRGRPPAVRAARLRALHRLRASLRLGGRAGAPARPAADDVAASVHTDARVRPRPSPRRADRALRGLALHLAYGELRERLATGGTDLVVLDTLDEDHLRAVGAAVLALPGSTFAIGSGGLSHGIAAAVPGAAATLPTATPRRGPVLAVSGSRSPQTRRQLDAAASAGWLVRPLPLGADRGPVIAEALAALGAGRSVALGSDDADTTGIPPERLLETIAEAAADVVRAAASADLTRRIVVCGGDTSSRITRLLGMTSLSIAANPWGNVVLLRAHSADPAIDGRELLLKGGQVGAASLLPDVDALDA